MKKAIIAIVIAGSVFACKKSTAPNTDDPVKYYFRIEAVDNDGQTKLTPYKTITIN